MYCLLKHNLRKRCCGKSYSLVFSVIRLQHQWKSQIKFYKIVQNLNLFCRVVLNNSQPNLLTFLLTKLQKKILTLAVFDIALEICKYASQIYQTAVLRAYSHDNTYYHKNIVLPRALLVTLHCWAAVRQSISVSSNERGNTMFLLCNYHTGTIIASCMILSQSSCLKYWQAFDH